VAKGVVYLVIGFLALREALGAGGKTADPGGAMKSIGSQPFGGVMLTLLAIDLACYALWKLVQGVLDADGKGSAPTASCGAWATWGTPRDPRHLRLYGGAVHPGSGGQLGGRRYGERLAYQPPLGQILVGLVGLGVIGVGLY
jgi:hypothetical protein